jgi:hypothetical protein
VKRRVSNVLAGASLVLCLATAVLYWEKDGQLQKVTSHKPIDGPWVGGHPRILFSSPVGEKPDPIWAVAAKWESQFAKPVEGRLLGFHWYARPEIQWPMQLGPVRKLGDVLGLDFPARVMMIAFSILPAYWLITQIRQQRQYRRSEGLCDVCGYDLRATPNRCPECGMIPPVPIARNI